MVLGREHKGLYFLQQDCQLNIANVASSHQSLLSNKRAMGLAIACFSDVGVWHFRLGHLPFEQLRFTDSISCNNTRSHDVCQMYPLAKLHKNHTSTSRAKVYFELLYVDIWGSLSFLVS